MTRALGIALASALALSPRPAAAYNYTRSDGGTPIRWPMRCIVVTPDARGDEADDPIQPEDIAAALESAAGAWNAAIKTCTPIRLYTQPASRALEAVSDGRPAVVFRAEFWGRGQVAYDPGAIAFTSVWYANRRDEASDGLISDGDIELNAVNYTFTTNTTRDRPRPGTELKDLQAVLTHELGHMLGLGHTCWNGMPGTVPLIDDTGATQPDCTNGPALTDKIRNSVMFPFATADPIAMRVVTADDSAAICDAYPNDGAELACFGFVEGPGCEISQASVVEGWALGAGLLVALALLVRRVRRRSDILQR